MIHYNVWFCFRDEVQEADGLATVHEFLRELCQGRSIARFQLLKNKNAATKTKLLPFQALIEFNDSAQFSAAFSGQATRGIHTGWHGRVLSVVSDFQIEIFEHVAPLPEPLHTGAWEA